MLLFNFEAACAQSRGMARPYYHAGCGTPSEVAKIYQVEKEVKDSLQQHRNTEQWQTISKEHVPSTYASYEAPSIL